MGSNDYASVDVAYLINEKELRRKYDGIVITYDVTENIDIDVRMDWEQIDHGTTIDVEFEHSIKTGGLEEFLEKNFEME